MTQQVQPGGKKFHLGTFTTFADAKAANLRERYSNIRLSRLDWALVPQKYPERRTRKIKKPSRPLI